jgi:HD-GYP domain-containing protein (c-di-GMP phosphodiesterase class II)
MVSADSTKKNLRVLSVIQSNELLVRVNGVLDQSFPSQTEMTRVRLLEEAIALQAKVPSHFQLILIEQASPDQTVLQAVLEKSPSIMAVVFTASALVADQLLSLPVPPEVVGTNELEVSFLKVLKKGAIAGKLPEIRLADPDEFVSVSSPLLKTMVPLSADVFIKLGSSRYVCVFKKGAVLEESDLQKFVEYKKDQFFIKKEEMKSALDQRTQQLDSVAAQPEVSKEQAREQFNSVHGLLRDVVTQAGFTPETQALAKSCVTMTLKALGSKPKLSAILADLRKKEGGYIAAHSFMIGNLACAMAHSIGWSSSSTFFKLSLAAFLHDISFSQEDLSRVSTLNAAQMGSLSPEDLKLIRLHPVKAAEYSKQFPEIPSDVDLILLQHHERPDGTGFPRGLSGKLISPLSALFIMAQDLVHELMIKPDLNTDTFFRDRADGYQVGQFKKIHALLLSAKEHD